MRVRTARTPDAGPCLPSESTLDPAIRSLRRSSGSPDSRPSEVNGYKNLGMSAGNLTRTSGCSLEHGSKVYEVVRWAVSSQLPYGRSAIDRAGEVLRLDLAVALTPPELSCGDCSQACVKLTFQLQLPRLSSISSMRQG
jgi:hypothetical protein